MLDVSISVSSYELCSVDSEDPFLLLFPIPFGPDTLYASSSTGLPELQEYRFDENFTFTALCSQISFLEIGLCIYLSPLPAGAWFSDYD